MTMYYRDPCEELLYYICCWSACMVLTDCCLKQDRIQIRFIKEQHLNSPSGAPKDSKNPFSNPNAPKDEHLEPAYI